MDGTKDLIQNLTNLIAVVAFLFGVFQYQSAQRWKRLEFAANQLQRLCSDPDLILATTFLNYAQRGVPLPEKYWDLTGVKVFPHETTHLSALLKKPYDNTPEYLVYEETFEHLFEYLEQIYDFIDMKLIKANDVKSLRWVLEDLANPRFVEKSLFVDRINKDFGRVLKLMKLFEIVA